MKKSPSKILESNKVILKPFSKEFISDKYLRWLNDDSITQFIDKAKENTSLEDLNYFAESMINSNKDYFFAIIYKKNNFHIGNVRLGPIDFNKKKSNFGILIGDKNYQGCGLGTDVIELIKYFGFEYLALDRIHFPVVKKHDAAMKLYAKTKFKCLGEMKKTFNKKRKSWKLVEWTMSSLDYKNDKNV